MINLMYTLFMAATYYVFSLEYGFGWGILIMFGILMLNGILNGILRAVVTWAFRLFGMPNVFVPIYPWLFVHWAAILVWFHFFAR